MGMASLLQGRGGIALGLLLLAFAFPAAASAATATVVGTTLTYTAGAGEANFVQFTDNGAMTRVTELGSIAITPGAGCATVTASSVDCTAATDINASTLDLDDSLSNFTAATAATLDGGSGDDSFVSASTAADTFAGGTQNGAGTFGDKIDYQLQAQGITATMDNTNTGSGTVSGASVGSTDQFSGIEVLGGSDAPSGDDVLTGDANANQLLGNRGNDTLSGGGGGDNLQGGEGSDAMDGGPGSDTMQDDLALPGANVATYASEPAAVTVTPGTPFGSFTTNYVVTTSTGTDQLLDVPNVTGSPFNDTLTGDAIDNILKGGAGADTIYGGGGNDTLDGESGASDLLDFTASTGNVNASLIAGTATDSAFAGQTDTIAGFENLTGGPGNDTLEGDTANNVISGGPGTNTLSFANHPAGVAVTVPSSGAGTTSGSAAADTVQFFTSVVGSPFPDNFNVRNSTSENVVCGGGADGVSSNLTDVIDPSCETIAPIGTANPVLSGTPQAGGDMTVDQGTFAGSPVAAYSYEWQRCDSGGGACATIASANAPTYTATAGDVGRTLRARVTGVNAAGNDARTSSASALIAAAPSGSTPASGGPGPDPAPPATTSAGLQPVFSQTADVEPVSGTVLVKVPGSSSYTRLTNPTLIPFGAIIDARKGRVRLRTVDAKGVISTADFYEGIFQLFQQRSAGGITELQLFGGDFKVCPKISKKAKKVRSAAGRKVKPTKSIRHLWGSGKGLFRTKGRYSSATIRGTTWLTDDRCDGTLTRVTKGAVTVRDFPRKRNVVVKAPKRYLARP